MLKHSTITVVMRGIAACLILASLLPLAACRGGNEEIASMGTLEVDRLALRAESTEPLVEVPVREGDRVAEGTLLARQDAERFEVALAQADAEVTVAEARLAEAMAGPRDERIAAARARVEAAASELQTAGFELERERSLVEQNYAAKNYADVLEGRFHTAEARKKEAEAQLAELTAGSRQEQIDAARGSLDAARARREAAALSLSRSRITAPTDGRVEAILYKLGERPKAGQPVIILLRDQAPFARVYVPEPIRAYLEPGARAEIHIDGVSRVEPGTLRWIAHEASYTPFYALTQKDRSHLSYLAEVDLTGDDAASIATGIPVEVFFPDVRDE